MITVKGSVVKNRPLLFLYRYICGVNDIQFIEYGYKVVEKVTPGKRFFRVPEPPRSVSLTLTDQNFELAIIDVPGVTTRRVAEFENVNGNWQFVRMNKL